MTRFALIELRTIDVDAARAFYAAVLGHAESDVVPISEASLARGARPHWLGHVGVDDVEQAALAFVARGAVRLGPTPSTRGDRANAILRDPGGAVVALTAKGIAKERPDVVWHMLHTLHLTRARDAYQSVLGWEVQGAEDLGALGVLHPFAWKPGGPRVGALADIGERRGVHPHWLFHFRVPSLERAVAHVQRAGGIVLDPVRLPSGERVAVCDDPQGAAFALLG